MRMRSRDRTDRLSGQPPIVWAAAEGARVTDIEVARNRLYIGHHGCNAGHSNDAIVQALREQASQLSACGRLSHPGSLRFLRELRALLIRGLQDFAATTGAK